MKVYILSLFLWTIYIKQKVIDTKQEMTTLKYENWWKLKYLTLHTGDCLHHT